MQSLFDIKRTQLQLVVDRGYVLPEHEVPILTMNLQQFTNYLRNLKRANPRIEERQLLSYNYQNEARNRSIAVEFAHEAVGTKQMAKSEASEIVDRLYKSGVHEAVIIATNGVGPQGLTVFRSLTTTRWQIFHDFELSFNVTHIADAQEHRLLSPEQLNAKLLEWKVGISNIIVIEETDPFVRYYNWPVGSVIKITRRDRGLTVLSPESLNYRVVIAGTQ